MMSYLNNILTNIMYLMASIIESYLFTTLLLLIFDVKSSKKQKALCMFLMIIIGRISSAILPSPFNIILNYGCIIIFITLIFKMSILKSFTSLMLTVFIYVLLNTLIQKPYLAFFNISLDTFLNTAKYRMHYLIILYSFFGCIVLFFKKFNNIKLKINTLDSLDNKTILLLSSNLLLGIFILFMQLLITDYYIDIVSVYINLFNFALMAAFLILSIHSITHMLELAITRKDLAYAEECNKSLEILYDKVRGFKHDFDNIVSSLNGYIEDNDMEGLKKYINEVKKDCKITADLSLINPHIINNPGIYSLLNNEYFKAYQLGIAFDIEFFIDFNSLNINIYKFSRMLGILIDNAIEAAEKCDEKIVQISFIRENINNRTVITVKNTYSNKEVNLEKIFEQGISNKENHSGFGLWEVKKYIKKSNNLELNTSKNNKYFIQKLFIYDS